MYLLCKDIVVIIIFHSIDCPVCKNVYHSHFIWKQICFYYQVSDVQFFVIWSCLTRSSWDFVHRDSEGGHNHLKPRKKQLRFYHDFIQTVFGYYSSSKAEVRLVNIVENTIVFSLYFHS